MSTVPYLVGGGLVLLVFLGYCVVKLSGAGRTIDEILEPPISPLAPPTSARPTGPPAS